MYDCTTGESVNSALMVSPWPPAAGETLSITMRDSTKVFAAELSYMGVVLFHAQNAGDSISLVLPESLPADGECKLTVRTTADCMFTSFQMSRMLLSDDLIETVNAQQTSWVAGRNVYFEGMDTTTAKKMMGAKKINPRLRPAAKVHDDNVVAALPTSFDSRAQWPNCTGPVLDQGRCGSCWAFGAAEAMSDRMCISSGTNQFLQLAALDLTVNDMMNDGCQGGDPGTAWLWGQSKGLVSEVCLPYGTWETPNAGPVPTCPPAKEPCLPNTFVNTPPSSSKCANGATYVNDKHKVKSVYSLTSVTGIMTDLVAHGPVEAAFTVYEDFVHYKSGVYKHTSGGVLGGHAVAIIGYGTLNNQAYWLVQNSWTTTWGAGGYFMIARGIDECGIESEVVAGTY
jgi:cathepsin B